MSSARSAIRMTDAETREFFAQQRTLVCASNGRHGAPHLMPLWYVARESGPDGATELWSWTFAKSQKARNIERDPRVTILVEAGLEYNELRGVMLETRVRLHRDLDTVRGVGLELGGRYGGIDGDLPPEARRAVEDQAPKRVAFQFIEQRRVTWDHRKLGLTA